MNTIFKFLIVILIFVFAQNVNASIISIDSGKNSIQVDGLYYIDIKLDTQNQSINTFEGDLAYDPNILQVEQINTGNSFVSFWVEKPVNSNDGKVHFSGVVPGGIVITEGNLFSVIFRGKSEGSTKIGINNASLFLNDGVGSNDPVKTKEAILNITKNVDGVFEKVVINDKNLPEKFKILRTKDQSIFDNKWFIVFSAQDKGVGISKYQVCEFFNKYCVDSTSPHLLRHQNPFYYIVVSAYDIEGNMRVSKLISPWIILSVIIIIFALIFLTLPYLRRYFRKYKV
jgi:hypothetical protein